MRTAACAVLLSVFGALGLTGTVAGGAGGVDLTRLKSIQVPTSPPGPVAGAARTSQSVLSERYGLKLPIEELGSRRDEPAIVVGRELAVPAGMITAAELDKVKFDGYVIKAADDRIALAGYRPIGTAIAAWALTERLGLKRYSGGRELPAAEVFTPLPDKRLPAFVLADRPFFEYRSVLAWAVIAWSCGESYGDLGNPREGANQDVLGKQAQKQWLPGEWLGGDHTAAYLVPKQLYYDEHPEYFAERNGKRLPKTTLMQRMSLCLSHPDVTRIACRRMADWMNIQKERRFFYCTDADSGPCQCPTCLRMDYLYGYDADRYMTWVNAVARTAAREHPDNRIFALAYQAMVKPPVRESLEPNVIVLYCPWYWTSANTRTATFADPRNLTAMEEITGWLMKFPHQVGIYDYPGFDAYQWLRGMEKRMQWYGRHGIRTVYCCGAPRMFDGLFHHVITRQLWDPLVDTGELEAEYVRASFGKAAEPILKLVRLNNQVWDEGLGDPMRDDDLAGRFESLFRQAEKLADGDPVVSQRVWGAALMWLGSTLQQTNPRSHPPSTEEELTRFRGRVLWYGSMARASAAEFQRANNRWMVGSRTKAIASLLKQLGIDPALVRPDGGPEAITEGIAVVPKPEEPRERTVRLLTFDAPGDAADWHADCPVAALAPSPKPAVATPPFEGLGKPRPGIAITLPLTKLPTRQLPIRPDGRSVLHAGWFVLSRSFATPLDASGCRYVDLTLDASCDLPVSVTLGTEGAGEIRSDILLHAGRQVARIDLDSHVRRRWPKEKWTGRLTSLKLVFWPQDALYPFPPARDAVVTLLGVAARTHAPKPSELPWAGRVVYLAQFRPNIPHDIPAPLALRPEPGHTEGASGIEAGFRTSTPNRVMTPIVAILAGERPSQAELDAARQAQLYFEKLCGVKLPINPPGMTATPDTGNAILLGRAAAGLVSEAELAYVGDEGTVLRAHNGRIAIAGNSTAGVLSGLARYLEDHGVRFFQPGVAERVPDLRDEFLHELIDYDWPYFADRPVPGGWKARSSAAHAQAHPRPQGERVDRQSVMALARGIKDSARAGSNVPPGVLAAAGASPLHAYVAARLLWNPYQDASRLIDDFQAPR